MTPFAQPETRPPGFRHLDEVSEPRAAKKCGPKMGQQKIDVEKIKLIPSP